MNDPKVKITAQDTGKRVDLSQVDKKKTTIRRHDTPTAEPKPRPMIKPVEIVAAPQVELSPAPKLEMQTLVEPMEFDYSGDFAAMLAESESKESRSIFNVGDKVVGKIVHIGQENIFVALGAKIEAAISTLEFKDDGGRLNVSVGDSVTAYVVSNTGGITLSSNAATAGLESELLKDAQENGMPVEGKVTAVNKGGFDVQVSGKRAFCPVGQIDLKFVEDTSVFVGQTLVFLIQRIEEGGRNIVLSRRALLERERAEKAKELIKNIDIGKIYNAVITRVADFGAFADIGGLEGLIPRSEISHGHIERVSDAVSSNDRVEVMVLSFEPDPKDLSKSRLTFSLKKTKEDPYTLHWAKIKEGNTLEGRVVRVESFGAFVQLFEGIDGLIHISELSENRVAHPQEVLRIGDPVSVRVVKVDDESRRIGLSLREAVNKNRGPVSAPSVERGQKAAGVVSRIERYGVFVELVSGVTALLPQSETGLDRNADLARHFNIGDKLEVAIIDVDAQNRVRVSLLARKKMEERDSYLDFQNKEAERSKGFGTLADLIKKT